MELQHLKKWQNELHRCIRCAYCFEGCPVYEELDWETDSARGKMVMAFGLLSGELEATQFMADKFYQCTFCKDCVERCSANVSVPDILTAVRADLWNNGFQAEEHKALLQKIERSGNIFDQKLEAPDFAGEKQVLLGCRLLDREEDSKKYLTILEKLGTKPKTFEESCCGMPFAVLGDTAGFKAQQDKFVGTLENRDEEIICACTTCVFFIRKKYPELNSKYIINEIVEKLPGYKGAIKKLNVTATYHDPCNVARGLDMVDEPRWLLGQLGVDLVEMKTYGKEATCCGGGGGLLVSDQKLADTMALNRVNEALETGAEYLVTLCPTCEFNLHKAAQEHNLNIKVKNVLDFVYEALAGNGKV